MERQFYCKSKLKFEPGQKLTLLDLLEQTNKQTNKQNKQKQSKRKIECL